MNILFVSHDFPPMDGGIAVFDYNICRELSARGHKVRVISNRFYGCKEFDSKQDFDIRRLNGRVRPTSLEAIYNILSLVLKEKIEIIFFGHFGSTHWLGGVLANKIFNIPYLILVHGNEFNAYFHRFTKADQWASKIVLKSSSAIIVNSGTTKTIVEDHGYPSSRIHIVHPGTDPFYFKPDVQEPIMIDKFGLRDKTILLSASRLVAVKNHENVLKALPSVIMELPNLIYLIAGKGQEEERLIKLTEDLELARYVKFVGYIEPKDMPLYYNLCDVFVMPSKPVDLYYETFGIVYIEANACGKPVIGGKTGGVEDAVIDGVTGLLVDPENVQEISQAIIRLLTDKDYARKLGGNGRRRVEAELSWNIVGKQIEGILRNTIRHGE